jgi:hypothetical protein
MAFEEDQNDIIDVSHSFSQDEKSEKQQEVVSSLRSSNKYFRRMKTEVLKRAEKNKWY